MKIKKKTFETTTWSKAAKRTVQLAAIFMSQKFPPFFFPLHDGHLVDVDVVRDGSSRPGNNFFLDKKKHRSLTLNKTRNKPGNPIYLNISYGYVLVRYVGISPVFKRLSKHGYIYICKNPDASKVSILRTWTPGIQVQTPPLKGPMLLRDVYTIDYYPGNSL